jgi:hypothetical protein
MPAPFGYDARVMTAEMLIIAIVRVLGSLPVLRWPFWGGLLAIAVDQSDLFLMNLLDLGGVSDYQTFDKYLDQVYLLAFLVVALRWQGAPRLIAVGLYVYRFVGFVAFEVTQERDLLLLFPNLFEFWFLFVAGLMQFRPRVGNGPKAAPAPGSVEHSGLNAGAYAPDVAKLWPVLCLLLALKLLQEYAIHYARWLDGFTAVEAVEAAWAWLTGPLT